MKRIDPAEVAKFYADNPNVKPVCGDFVERRGGNVVGCCGLTSQFIRNHGGPPTLESSGFLVGVTNVLAIAQSLGISCNYAIGFVCGWDDVQCADDEESRTGYADGVEAYVKSTEAKTP